MMIELYRDLIRHLAKKNKVSCGQAESSDRERLKKYSDGFPVDFYSVMISCWPTETISAGPYSFFPLSEILDDTAVDDLYRHGLMLLGHASNGDHFVMKIGAKWANETPVGLVGHEEYYPGDDNPNDFLAIVAGDICEFLYRAVEERYLPIDYYRATEFQQLKDKYGPEKPPHGG